MAHGGQEFAFGAIGRLGEPTRALQVLLRSLPNEHLSELGADVSDQLQ
jgi:hypothetical protein